MESLMQIQRVPLPTKEAPPPKYYKNKRLFLNALKAFLLWIRNPVSDQGAKQVFRILYSMFGREAHWVVGRMKRKPEVRKIFEARADLTQILSDMDSLGKLPEGSLGKVYHDFMDGDEIIPGYILGGLAYREGHFDALVDWDDDVKFMLLRGGVIHDISHVISGYGTNLSGETLVGVFTAGSISTIGIPPRLVSIVIGGIGGLLLLPVFMPRCGVRKWVAAHMDAAYRGAVMAQKNTLAEIHYEELLHLPLKEVRIKLGIPPIKHQEYVNEDGFLNSKDWMRGWLGKRIENSFDGKDKMMEKMIVARTLIENGGFGVREVLTAPEANIYQAYYSYVDGKERNEVLAELNDYSYT